MSAREFCSYRKIRFIRARTRVRGLMTRKSCAVGMRNAILGNPLNRPFARSGHMVQNHTAGEQLAQWDGFQNKGRSRLTGTSCLVLEVPLCNLHCSLACVILYHVTGSCKGPIPSHYHTLQSIHPCIRYLVDHFSRGPFYSRLVKLLIRYS